MVVLLVVFLASAGAAALIQHQYRLSDRRYAQAADQYTRPSQAPQEVDLPREGEEAPPPVLAPITVDFAALRSVNPDVAGWLYCEGTPINYPVLQGETDDTYLHRSYDRSYSAAGSIFVEADNRPEFQDANTIIYGHHMKNGSMFSALENWSQPGFYEAHPIMWLLTPERDYRVVLFSGYTTSAYSETYTIFSEPEEGMDWYLPMVLEASDFQADAALDEAGRYVVLSTCAYVFDQARYVLHGILEEADSAGGLPLTAEP